MGKYCSWYYRVPPRRVRQFAEKIELIQAAAEAFLIFSDLWRVSRRALIQDDSVHQTVEAKILREPAVTWRVVLALTAWHVKGKLSVFPLLASELCMQALGLPLIVQLCLVFGMAGLLWPEKVKPVFEVLMFPWFPTYRTLRIHSIGALAFSAVLFLTWIISAN